MKNKFVLQSFITAIIASVIYYICLEIFAREGRSIGLNLISTFICFAIIFVLSLFLFYKKPNNKEDNTKNKE